jgi:hypothetical protein
MPVSIPRTTIKLTALFLSSNRHNLDLAILYTCAIKRLKTFRHSHLLAIPLLCRFHRIARFAPVIEATPERLCFLKAVFKPYQARMSQLAGGYLSGGLVHSEQTN